MTAMEVVPSEARTFLEELFASKPDELHILLWTLPEKTSYWFRDVEQAIQFAESRGDRDLYVGVGLSSDDYGPTRRCVSSEVAGIVGLWADLDLASAQHSKKPLPATVEEALKILPQELPPTFLILTGNGVHAWWLFKEPLIFETEQERADAASLAKRWQKLFSLNAANYGWAFDHLSDLARVLRVPGTHNCKERSNPKPVEIYRQTDQRYNLSDLAEYLDDLGIPDPEAQEQAAREWKQTFADKPLVIDPSAAVPDDLLNRCTANDSRFQKTWLRQRDDLADQSQSGYDLALANFGAATGMSEQQVVDLIIHHRRIHRQQQRTTIEYFQRTLSKAFKRRETMIHASSSGSPIQEAHATQTGPEPDAPTARALRCEHISNAIGVRVLRIIKVSGQEPTYRVELENTKVSFPCVDKLIGQQSFRVKIASAVEYLVPQFSKKVWEQIAQLMLSAVTIEDGGAEAELEGAARMYLEGYLSESPFIQVDEKQPRQTKSKPAIIEGQVTICSHELLQHIKKTWNENLSIKDVVAMLSALGAKSERLKGTQLRDQTRWFLPPDVFPPESSDPEDA